MWTHFEPQEIEMLLAKSVPVVRGSFNAKGLPDYSWLGIDGHSIGVSRKQSGELLASLDNAEEQLSRDMQHLDEMYLLVEGVFGPALVDNKLGTQIWIPTEDGKLLHPGHKFHTTCGMLYSWLYQLDKSGITYLPTFDWTDTATAIVAMYSNSQKKEHTTLKRYIKTLIKPKEKNPHVMTLMGIVGARIGEKTAIALIDKYQTVWEVIHAEPEELADIDGIGIVMARNLRRALSEY